MPAMSTVEMLSLLLIATLGHVMVHLRLSPQHKSAQARDPSCVTVNI
jgi:hypothetical protein